MSENISARNTNEGLLPAESRAVGFDTLNNPVNSLEMFPDEPSDSGIPRHGLERTIGKLVAGLWTFDRDIVGKRLGPIGNLGTQDMGDITLENGGGVGPTHRENGKSEGT